MAPAPQPRLASRALCLFSAAPAAFAGSRAAQASGVGTIYGGWCSGGFKTCGDGTTFTPPGPMSMSNAGWFQRTVSDWDATAPKFGFANQAAGVPPPPRELEIAHRFTTFGGANVLDGYFPNSTEDLDDFVFQNWTSPWYCRMHLSGGAGEPPKCGMGLGLEYNGVDFDMESRLYEASWLPGSLRESPLLKFMEVAQAGAQERGLPPLGFSITVMGNQHNTRSEYVPVTVVEEVIDKFDYVTLMLYGGNMGTCGGGKGAWVPCGDWCVPEAAEVSWLEAERPSDDTCGQKSSAGSTSGNAARGCGTLCYLRDWLGSKIIPREKIILGMTTWGAEDYMVKLYADIVKEYGLAGVMFWDPANFKGGDYLTTLAAEFGGMR